MSSPNKENEPSSSSVARVNNGASGSGGESASLADARPPSKRRYSNTVIEISDTDSDDSDVCAVNSYQASADEVKRIRGADYSSSSSSSSSDYSSDSESPWEDDSVLLEDEKAGCHTALAQLNPRANRMDDPKFNPRIMSQELIDRLSTHWKELKDYACDEVTLTCEPFRVCLLHNFLDNPEIINNIVDDMNTLDWSRKKMDLYEFHQTADLASLTWQRSIRGIYELLKTEVMNWVSQVTGVRLSSVSASCSLYGPGDHLLVHDDLLADRRVAFILYLAPWKPNAKHYHMHSTLENGQGDHKDSAQSAEAPGVGGAGGVGGVGGGGGGDGGGGGWGPHMGGALELLACDADGQPARVAHRVYPRNNMLAFFKVGSDSYHQVGEVLSLELPRLSINGWFHGPAPGPEPGVEPEPPPSPAPEQHRPHNEVVVLAQWVDGAYMSPRARAQVQAQMERASEACLRGLLAPAARRRLAAALRGAEVPWEARGPAHRRRYERVPRAWAAAQARDHALRGLLDLLAAAPFVRLLADCTDLALATYSRLELQRWSPGDFTLLPSRERYRRPRLEAVMYLGVPERALSGGSTTYVAVEEAGAGADGADEAGEGAGAGAADGALVTLPPVNDALNLVYCDAGAASFTKYLSKMTMRPDEHFYIVTCTYEE